MSHIAQTFMLLSGTRDEGLGLGFGKTSLSELASSSLLLLLSSLSYELRGVSNTALWPEQVATTVPVLCKTVEEIGSGTS